MSKKTVPFNNKGIEKLPIDKPVLYQIQTAGGKTNYTGIAQRGRAQDRLKEHLAEKAIPGAKVKVEQMSSIGDARKKEAALIDQHQPRYNTHGKA